MCVSVHLCVCMRMGVFSVFSKCVCLGVLGVCGCVECVNPLHRTVPYSY